jgi:hypothetical protein
MGALLKILEIIKKKKNNEKITRREISFPTFPGVNHIENFVGPC